MCGGNDSYPGEPDMFNLTKFDNIGQSLATVDSSSDYIYMQERRRSRTNKKKTEEEDKKQTRKQRVKPVAAECELTLALIPVLDENNRGYWGFVTSPLATVGSSSHIYMQERRRSRTNKKKTEEEDKEQTRRQR